MLNFPIVFIITFICCGKFLFNPVQSQINKLASFPLENSIKHLPYEHVNTSVQPEVSPIINAAKQLLDAQRISKLPSVAQALSSAVEQKENKYMNMYPYEGALGTMEYYQKLLGDFGNFKTTENESNVYQQELAKEHYLPTEPLLDADKPIYPELDALADQVLDLITIILKEHRKDEETDEPEIAPSQDEITEKIAARYEIGDPNHVTFGQVASFFNYPREKMLNSILKAAPTIFKQLRIPPMEESYTKSAEILASFFLPFITQLEFMENILSDLEFPSFKAMLPEGTEFEGWFEGIMRQFMSIAVKMNEDSTDPSRLGSSNIGWLEFSKVLESSTQELNDQFLTLLSQKIGDLANSALNLRSMVKPRFLRGA